jgi:hypothetical protein
MEPDPPVDLEMHPRQLIFIDLVPVHAEVALTGFRVLSVDERQRKERTAVAGPCLDLRKGSQAGGLNFGFQDRPGTKRPGSHSQERVRQIPELPEAADRRRHQHIRSLDDSLKEARRIFTNGEIETAARSKKVRYDREICAGDVREKKGRTLPGYNPALNLRQLQMRIDQFFDYVKFLLPPQSLEEAPQVTMSHVFQSVK